MNEEEPQKAVLLDTCLRNLQEAWLDLHCCNGTTHYPLKLMAQRFGGELTLRNALPRLRCRKCRGAPPFIALLETGLTDGKGRPRGWRLVLRSSGSPTTPPEQAAK
ncbi:MAG: hypothetical protein E5X57_22015 [Mesorhizobium sp.]|uniref:hypothetical protein n=1 Tax=Mesorhizobium sp. TaxID=1871066 RepID=UPI0012287023|nr:hypothetical protein [Mesorhizobium sp.]TIQ08761.1 MAG: hypothetical protein E5X57_22015 [Mesorhizobium sp.]TJV92305.1 MAG: hypothetical protein E5X52_33625 [Mesorhizobium sp.]